MARAAPARPTETADAAVAPFGEWFESQQRLLSLAMDQWAGMHELWLRGVHQQLDAWNTLWRAEGAPALTDRPGPTAWTELPAAYTDAMQRATQAWWGPWLPLLQRGGEQLA